VMERRIQVDHEFNTLNSEVEELEKQVNAIELENTLQQSREAAILRNSDESKNDEEENESFRLTCSNQSSSKKECKINDSSNYEITKDSNRFSTAFTDPRHSDKNFNDKKIWDEPKV